jgi:hypothetical protein
MPFKKGDVNINTKGRLKGVGNKTTTEVKTLLLSVFEENLNEILSQQHKLSLNERIMLNKTILPYILPPEKTDTTSLFIEQPIFPDVDVFDVKHLFKIGEL